MDPTQFLAQQKFDQLYVSSSEICKRLNVTRPAIHFRRKQGELPGAISIFGQQLFIWERDTIEPYLLKWEQQLAERRNGQTA